MPPAIRELKKHQIRTLFNVAIQFLDSGDRDTAFECLIKIQGMMAAFDQLDGALCAYAKLAESAFITYTECHQPLYAFRLHGGLGPMIKRIH